MQTQILKVDSKRPQLEIISRAAEVIRSGGLCAFPTETVYGLGANGFDEKAIEKIFKAKGRPADNPLILHICKMEQLFELCKEVPTEVLVLAMRFWPGPLTFVLKKTDKVPDGVSKGLDTVAVRMPSHPVALALIEASGVPIAAPSANLSGRPSPTNAGHVLEDLGGRIDMILDGGQCEVGLESTVLHMALDTPRLLRPGGITPEQLLQVLTKLDIDPAVTGRSATSSAASSPGVKYLHYAPKAPLILVKGSYDNVTEFLKAKVAPDTGILCFEGEQGLFEGAVVKSLGDASQPHELAASLFSVLRSFDGTGVRQIFARYPSDEGMGLAVVNRLLRAAGFKVINV